MKDVTSLELVPIMRERLPDFRRTIDENGDAVYLTMLEIMAYVIESSRHAPLNKETVPTIRRFFDLVEDILREADSSAKDVVEMEVLERLQLPDVSITNLRPFWGPLTLSAYNLYRENYLKHVERNTDKGF